MDEKDRVALQSLPPERREKIEQLVGEAKARQRRQRLWIAAGFVAVLGLMAVAVTLSNRGRASAGGIRTVARVDRAPDGSCIVGEKRAHCYALHLTVYPPGGKPYVAKIDVNVPDRWASRVQPGSFVVVAVNHDASEVSLDMDTLAAPPPAPPASTDAR